MSATAVSPSALQFSQAERWEIADQLRCLLQSPWFRTSSRCSKLLAHVVEAAIHGQADQLKERQIAIDAFYRKPTYDNNIDPVVRVVAGEVRKRLAQYYGNPDASGQVRIELPIGHYVPIFHFARQSEPISGPVPTDLHIDKHPLSFEGKVRVEPKEPRRHVLLQSYLSRYRVWLAISGAVILLTASVGIWRTVQPIPRMSGFDSFWAPILSQGNTPLISVGVLSAKELTFIPDTQRNPLSETFSIKASEDNPSNGIQVERIAYLQAAAKVASVFGAKSKAFDLRDQSETTFADFGGRPTILLGSFDNDWTIGVTQQRRFQFKADSERKLRWIADQNKPGEEIGTLSSSSPEPTTYDCFAIVMRLTGMLSGQPRMVLAGVGDLGTIAAAEFVSNPKYLNDFVKRAPKDWANRNIEFLIRTRVIENVVGVPTIVDYSVW